MAASETEIANLLFRYAEMLDDGDIDGVGALFAHARVKFEVDDEDGALDGEGLRQVWDRCVIRYPDGTPRSQHVTTNPIIEVDEDAGTATCRSYYTVFQHVEGSPLQPISSGRYSDRFERVDGVWRFSFRDFSRSGLIGDMSRHFAFEKYDNASTE